VALRVCLSSVIQPRFPNAEPLLADTGEQFFSECITFQPRSGKFDDREFCLCAACVALQQRVTFLGTPSPKPNIDNTTAVDTVAISKPDTNCKAPEHKATTPSPLQQQQLYQPPNNHNHNELVVHNTPQVQILQPTCVSFPPAYFQPAPPPFIPFHCYKPMPMPMPMHGLSCCAKHNQWMLSARIGRPPHDHHCHVRHQQPLHRQRKALLTKTSGEDR